MTTDGLGEVKRSMVRLLKKYRRAAEDGTAPEERTPVLRDVAECVVDGRSHFLREDGSTDWLGRTYAYRAWIREVFGEAGIPRDEVPTVQAAIRYHIGAVLRARLDEATLAEYGLIDKSPRERSADRRHERTAIYNAATAREIGGGVLIALSAADKMLAGVKVSDLNDLDAEALQVAGDALRRVERRVRSLLAHMTPAT